MASTKTAKTFQSSATNTAGSTTTGSAVALTTSYGCLMTATITNGGTGPTVACDFIVEVSNDNFSADTKEVYRATASTVANEVNSYVFELPGAVMYARSKFTGNTGQSVTVACTGQELTTI